MKREHRGRRWPATIAAVAVTALIASSAALASAFRHASGPQDTPSGKALVVSANLQDAIRPADARDPRDLDNFVRRITAATPHAPDVLLLTEILGPGADRVADRMTAATGHRYRVVAAPGRSAFGPDAAVRQSAILIDSTSMRVLDKGRFARVQEEDQAYALLAQKRTGLRIPVVSAHAAGDPQTAVRALHSLLEKAGQDTAQAVPVLGGDYRAGRCIDTADYQPVDCTPQPFWKTATETYGYDDAVFGHSGAATRRGSAHVFARGSVSRARLDTAYDTDLPDRAACKKAFDTGESASADDACRREYYADAPFGWATVGAGKDVQRSVAPAQITLDHCELGTRKSAALARVVNNTGKDITDEVSAEADAPLKVTAGSGSVTVPAGQARTVPLRVTAPQDVGPGSATVTVDIGPVTARLKISLPKECTEAAVVATSYHPGTQPEAAVDGDINTFWHSEYSPPNPLPQSITLNLKETKQVSRLTYQPRFDGNLNGTITGYNVYTSTDGQAFTKAASGTWSADARLKTASFDPVQARYVRLEATTASGGSFCSAAEITTQ
ncbi:discoidin domain-containing protein [Streptomyces boninensis]|uniref:discoidin domain-containing protein n=1 Tax=Streptomyces boninensis TaxID=2039455 RepID=UPI003B218D07